MHMRRRCQSPNKSGGPCLRAPLRERDFCYWHDPENVEEAARARALGGTRRRREGAVSGAYEFDGLATVADIRRLLEVAAYDGLALENSVARVRALTSVAQVAARLLEVADLEQRVRALEETLGARVPERIGGSR